MLPDVNVRGSPAGPPPEEIHVLRLGLVTALLALLGAGCGRRATEADCQLIVDKSVELQSKEMSETDPAAIADREKRIRAELEDDVKQCENRRVTEKMMACVKGAASTKELEECLR